MRLGVAPPLHVLVTGGVVGIGRNTESSSETERTDARENSAAALLQSSAEALQTYAQIAPDTASEYDTIRAASMVEGKGRIQEGSGLGIEEGTSSSEVPVCMWVLDEGPGIQRKDWNKVFTPFETLHSGILTAEGQGSGLGLAITATLMRMHSGCVGVSSASGVGSVFFLWTRMQVGPDLCRSPRMQPLVARSTTSRSRRHRIGAPPGSSSDVSSSRSGINRTGSASLGLGFSRSTSTDTGGRPGANIAAPSAMSFGVRSMSGNYHSGMRGTTSEEASAVVGDRGQDGRG